MPPTKCAIDQAAHYLLLARQQLHTTPASPPATDDYASAWNNLVQLLGGNALAIRRAGKINHWISKRLI